MKYLKSVNSFIDESTCMVYICINNYCGDTKEGVHLKNMNEEWWSKLDQTDMARIDIKGGLF